MAIKESILPLLNNPRMRSLLGWALKTPDETDPLSDLTIRRYIKGNSDNLTKAAALNVIRQELNLKDEEILESDPVMTMQK